MLSIRLTHLIIRYHKIKKPAINFNTILHLKLMLSKGTLINKPAINFNIIITSNAEAIHQNNTSNCIIKSTLVDFLIPLELDFPQTPPGIGPVPRQAPRDYPQALHRGHPTWRVQSRWGGSQPKPPRYWGCSQFGDAKWGSTIQSSFTSTPPWQVQVAVPSLTIVSETDIAKRETFHSDLHSFQVTLLPHWQEGVCFYLGS